MSENKFLPFQEKEAGLLSERYLTKRMSLILKNGDIVTGFMWGIDESDFEEETGVECDWGFELRDAMLNDKSLGYDLTIPLSRIKRYCPLEQPNTDEEIEQMLSGKKA